MRPYAFAFSCLIVLALGCTSANQPTQEQVRQDAAATTRTIVSGVKGAAQGIKDGLHQAPAPATININTATRPNLEILPGITPPLARQIIAHRPYKAPADLRAKRVLSQSQYDEIATRISVD